MVIDMDKRYQTVFDWLTKYIRRDNPDYPSQDGLSGNPFKYFRSIFYRYDKDLKTLIEKYSRNPFIQGYCGEYDFQNALNYFENRPDYFSVSENKTHNAIAFSADSLNLKVNRILLHALYESLRIRIQDGDIKRLSDEKETIEGFDPFLFRQLMMIHCIKLSGDIGAVGQFTISGERLIGNGNIDENSQTITAVPFREAESLSCIDSIRLYEKIIRRIFVLSSEGQIDRKVIRIAIFGELSNSVEGFRILEHLVEKKTGNKWRIEPVFFSLQKLTPFGIFVAAESDGKAIEGSLLDRHFYLEICKHFDMICLLDTGYLYYDTNKFSDAYGSNANEAVRARFGSLEFLADQADDGVEKIGFRFYDGLYTSIMKWIEKQFYEKNHSFTFDPRLFFTLKSLQGEIGSCSLYLFLSRDRGRALSSSLKHRNLCKGEYFEGREVIAYDWSSHGSLTQEEIIKRNHDIISDYYSEKNEIPVRLWKLLKSMGKYFYSKGFVNLFTDGPVTDESMDEGFIDYALNTFIFINYSQLQNNEIRFEVGCAGNYTNIIYDEIAKQFVSNLLHLALDSRCFEECSTGFCRRVLVNAMITDAIGIDHLLVAQKLWDKKYLIGEMSITASDNVRILGSEEPITTHESNALFAQRHEDNLALKEAIGQINDSDDRKESILVDIINSYIPSIQGRDNHTMGINIVRKAKNFCKTIGYQESGFFID